MSDAPADDRTRLLDAALAHVPFDGWSDAALSAAIAAAVHLIDDGRVEISGSQKIGVKRMHGPIVDRQRGSAQSLSENLATEHLGTTDVLA